MSRWHRSSDGPVPYGPSGRPPEPGGPSEPSQHDAGDATEVWSPPAAATPADAGQGAPHPGVPPPPPPGVPGPPSPPPSFGAPPQGDANPIAPWAPPPGAYSSSVPGAAGLQYGRTLDRVMAYWLDGIIINLPTLIVALIVARSLMSSASLEGATVVASIIAAGANLLYFVAFWTGTARATPGMRLMKLQIAEAATGTTLTVQQGLVRWLAIGGAFQIVELVPPLAGLGVLLGALWVLLLLATTATSPTRQGLHDRIAGSALVQPMGAQTPAMTCLVIVIGLFALWLIGVVALVFLGTQVSSILSSVGSSI
jgi:uncharacterized RDD family membrane protein YckC